MANCDFVGGLKPRFFAVGSSNSVEARQHRATPGHHRPEQVVNMRRNKRSPSPEWAIDLTVQRDLGV